MRINKAKIKNTQLLYALKYKKEIGLWTGFKSNLESSSITPKKKNTKGKFKISKKEEQLIKFIGINIMNREVHPDVKLIADRYLELQEVAIFSRTIADIWFPVHWVEAEIKIQFNQAEGDNQTKIVMPATAITKTFLFSEKIQHSSQNNPNQQTK